MRATGLLLLASVLSAEDLIELRPLPLRLRSSAEIIDLAGNEQMGLAGLHLDLLEPTPIAGLYAGLGGYGAAGGDRGGLFVLGASLGWRSPSWQGLRLDANGFAGGGGGASAGQGGGLMLRGELMATLGLGSWDLAAGFARSEFPDGTIASSGWTVGLHHLLEGTLAAPWRGAAAPATVLTWERWSIAPHYLAYLPSDDDRGRNGAALARRLDLVGIALEHHLDRHWRLPIQASGALGGGAAGYMEVLSGLVWRPVVIGGLHLDARLLAGLGGGGNIDTGGGFIARPELGLALDLGSAFSLGARAGWVTTLDGDFDGTALTGELRWNTQHLALASGSTRATLPAAASELTRWRVVIGDAWYDVRSSAAADIHLVGLAVERPLSPWLSLIGRGRSAWQGDAGGYSEGLFGMRLGSSWGRLAVALQAQAGAGGGGGLATGNGVIGDLQLTTRLRLSETLALHLGGGRVEAHDGDFSANVLEAGLVWSCAVAR